MNQLSQLIDTHAHLNDDALHESPEVLLSRARAAGVIACVVPGVDQISSFRGFELVRRHPDSLRAGIGVHPHEIVQPHFDLDAALSAFRPLLDTDRSQRMIVAIGEVGIDYHHYTREETGARQREAFGRFCALAQEYDLPVIIHGREAYDDVLAVAQEFSGLRAVLHSFEAPYEVAKRALDRGWYMSLTALITYGGYDWLREVVAKLPLDRLMLETDSPYLPPQLPTMTERPRGRTNEPASVRHVAERLATIRHQPIEEVTATTTRTARQFFALP